MSDSSCDSVKGHLTPYSIALDNLINAAQAVKKTEKVALTTALNRVLAASLTSDIEVPPADNSAMDGYAVNSSDVSQSGEIRLLVSQRISAGEVGQPLRRGTAARIFTGAPIPKGADIVIMQEQVQASGDQIALTGPYAPKTNVRFAAEDIAKGEQILHAGMTIRAQEMGVAASIGYTHFDVFRQIKVGVFFTGDELTEPGKPLMPGQIYDSNRYTIIGLLQSLGCEIVDLGIVADTLEETKEALALVAGKADLIITSGGVSVGEEDYVRAAVESLGKLDMWRVKIKPGKPLAFGEVNGTPFLGLPGNPVAVFVTFCLFVSPFIKCMQGKSKVRAHALQVKADFSWTAGKRCEFVRARLVQNTTGQSVVQIYHHQGSGVLASTSWSDGLVMIPEGRTVRLGDMVDYTAFTALL